MNNELVVYKMNKHELKIWNQFCNDVLAEFDKMEIDEEYRHYALEELQSRYYVRSCGYSEAYGYFQVEFGDRGESSLAVLTQDTISAKMAFMRKILWNCSIKWECRHRKELQAVWECETRYDGRRHHFAYVIQHLLKVYTLDAICDLIQYDSDCMNHWFDDQHWVYDVKKQMFVEISDSKENKTMSINQRKLSSED